MIILLYILAEIYIFQINNSEMMIVWNKKTIYFF